MRRSIWFWISFCVAIVLAVYFISRIIMVGMGHGSMARLHKTSIIADIENKDMTALSAAAALPKNTPLYSIDLNEINSNILSVPGVKDSATRRLPNGNLIIHVSYHHFVAAWTDGESYFPLSDDGTIANNPSSERPTTAILFRGPVPNDITEITNAANDMLADIDYLEWIENRRWDIHTTGGITIKLPEKDFGTAIASLITINKNHNILGRDIRVIDMRDTARILVK
ncbi:MAG: cell division protein FtsQ/DivIB [Alphaproteobacteria bacterium]|nr:cell division protein FtsQ/DivIB [Alphaproteobacteria bacterium]